MDGVRCAACGGAAPDELTAWRCSCGGPWALEQAAAGIVLAALPDRGRTQWRYREALPVGIPPVTLGEGLTPLLPSRDGRLVFKIEGANPTGSFKDRGASVLVTHLVERGACRIVEDSSGNAGAAIAAYGARAGLEVTIYVPEGISPAKLAQVRAYGAQVARVPGTREDVARAAEGAAGTYASHCWSPAFFHGTKTVAFELCEQLGWRAPDWVIVAVGHGTLLLGLALGFRELRAAGILPELPKLIAVQSAACAPLAGPALGLPAGDGRTVAEGVRIQHPVRAAEIRNAVVESGGRWAVVREPEILDAQARLGAEGLFVEPTAAVAPAAAWELLGRGELVRSEAIVVPLTGHGLKATPTA